MSSDFQLLFLVAVADGIDSRGKAIANLGAPLDNDHPGSLIELTTSRDCFPLDSLDAVPMRKNQLARIDPAILREHECRSWGMSTGRQRRRLGRFQGGRQFGATGHRFLSPDTPATDHASGVRL
jgi:hypothetical protein